MEDDRPVLGIPGEPDDPIRVDSAAEQEAFLGAYAPARATARIAAGPVAFGSGPALERVVLVVPGGEERTILFNVSGFVRSTGGRGGDAPATERVETWMRTAEAFARENGPSHPGTVARFPVPSARYPGRLDVPLAVLASDGGRRGIYAPPRVVTLDQQTGEPFGIGEFPGFAPEDWPPPRLGDWPPLVLRGVAPRRLEAMVARFSACLTRLIAAYFDPGAADYPHRLAEAAETRALLGVLCLPEMARFYARLNPAYDRWWAGSD